MPSLRDKITEKSKTSGAVKDDANPEEDILSFSGKAFTSCCDSWESGYTQGRFKDFPGNAISLMGKSEVCCQWCAEKGRRTAVLIRESGGSLLSWLVSRAPVAALPVVSCAKVDEMKETEEPGRAKTAAEMQKEKDPRVKFLARLVNLLPYLDRNQTQFGARDRMAVNARKTDPALYVLYSKLKWNLGLSDRGGQAPSPFKPLTL
jgi:hypothetical protein